MMVMAAVVIAVDLMLNVALEVEKKGDVNSSKVVKPED